MAVVVLRQQRLHLITQEQPICNSSINYRGIFWLLTTAMEAGATVVAMVTVTSGHVFPAPSVGCYAVGGGCKLQHRGGPRPIFLMEVLPSLTSVLQDPSYDSVTLPIEAIAASALTSPSGGPLMLRNMCWDSWAKPFTQPQMPLQLYKGVHISHSDSERPNLRRARKHWSWVGLSSSLLVKTLLIQVAEN